MSAAPPTPKATTTGKRQPMDEGAWQNEFGKHRQRLEKQKSCIPKPAMAAPLGGSLKSPRKVPVSPRSTPKTQKSETSSGRASASMTLDSLPAAERRVCEDMIGVLFNKSEEEGKSLLQAVFLAAESKRLLANYGGVYPSLDTMNGGSQVPSNTGSIEEPPRRQQ